jgi:hypothetical protein
MTLTTFLTTHAPLTAVEVLPNNRLINAVIENDKLYGVYVENVPSSSTVTRLFATYDTNVITTSTGLTFNTDEYVMLGIE